MKKIKILSIAIMVMLGMVASAQTINVDNLTLKTNETGSINIQLNGGSTFIASGFIVELPEGFIFTGDVTNGTSNHVTRTYLLNDHTMKVAIFSNQNMAFGSNSFVLLGLKVKAPNRTGTYQGKIVGIEYASESGSLVTKIDVSFSITVNSASGDVNNDGVVDISDVVLTVNYILGSTSAVFNQDAADINKDGNIDISDVVALVNMILNGTGTGMGDTPQAYLTCPDGHHPHLIDLGLPSGTKWACCNVGATKPEEYGGYYAWGETEEKDEYTWSNYIHCDGSSSTCHEVGDIMGTVYDVAYMKWRDGWLIPSLEQAEELISNCTYEWTTMNGINGCLLTGKNGGQIFLPANGYRKNTDSSLTDRYSLLWLSVPNAENNSSAYRLVAGVTTPPQKQTIYNYYGQGIRPVTP